MKKEIPPTTVSSSSNLKITGTSRQNCSMGSQWTSITCQSDINEKFLLK